MAGALLVGGRAMSALLYLLIGIMAFGACYAVYGLGILIARSIRYRSIKDECYSAQHRRRPF
jgi:hypothetical protein